MSAEPQVSVVMPARNAANHISDSIRSVQRQSRADWELLVVDDASTDGTRRVVERSCQGDPRVRLIGLNSQVGVSAARNIGLDAARGRYVLLLDSDDLLVGDAMAALVLGAEKTSLGSAAGGYRVLGEQNQCIHRHAQRLDSIALDDLIDRTYLVTGCHLIERRWFDDHRFDASLDAYEDLDLWLRLAGAGVRWRCVPQEVCAYRVRRDSLSSRAITMGRACCSVLSRAFEASRGGAWPARLSNESERRERVVRRSRMLTYATRSVIAGSHTVHEDAACALAGEARSQTIRVDEATRAARFGFIFGLGLSPEQALESHADRFAALRQWWAMLEGAGLAERSLASNVQSRLAQSGRYASTG